MTHFHEWGKANPVERRAMVQAEVRSLGEEQRKAKVVGLGFQGAWTRWDLPKRKLTWADLWRLEPFRISFLIRAVYDTLPTPVNLHRWGMSVKLSRVSSQPQCLPKLEKGFNQLRGCME